MEIKDIDKTNAAREVQTTHTTRTKNAEFINHTLALSS